MAAHRLEKKLTRIKKGREGGEVDEEGRVRLTDKEKYWGGRGEKEGGR